MLRKHFICQQSINRLTPSVFNTWFSFFSDQHNYKTSSSIQSNLINPPIEQIGMGSIQ